MICFPRKTARNRGATRPREVPVAWKHLLDDMAYGRNLPYLQDNEASQANAICRVDILILFTRPVDVHLQPEPRNCSTSNALRLNKDFIIT